MRVSRVCAGTVLMAFLSIPAWSGTGAEDQAKPAASDEDSAQTKLPRKTRVRFGGLVVGAGYAHSSYPYLGYPYGYYPYSWSPAWPHSSVFWDMYMPMYYPGFYSRRGPSWDRGEVKLHAEPRTAEVYLNGAYAGTVADLKTIRLEPGAYNLEVKADQRSYRRRIYVLSGKTLKIDAALTATETEKRP